MIKTVSRALAATAALGLVAAPIVAEANTRAGSNAAVYSVTNAAPGLGRSADGEEQAESGLLTAIITAVSVTSIVVGGLVAGDIIGENNDDEDASPGT